MPHLSRKFPPCRQGTTALEFAICAPAMFALLLGSFEVGYDFFVVGALDNAVQTAARSVQVGTATGAATGSAAAAWVTSQICPQLSKLLSCSGLIVTIDTIPSGTGQNYYTYLSANPPSLTSFASASNPVCTGTGGQLMLLRAYYLSPTFLGMLVPAWSQVSPVNGARVHVSYASAGFVNEYFSGGKTGC